MKVKNFRVIYSYDGMTYEVIDEQQAKNLLMAWEDVRVDKSSMLLVNDKMIRKDTILRIEPTTELTQKQKEQRKIARQLEQNNLKEAGKWVLERLNKRYGEGKWSFFLVRGKKLVTPRERDLLIDKYLQAKEVKKLEHDTK